MKQIYRKKRGKRFLLWRSMVVSLCILALGALSLFVFTRQVSDSVEQESERIAREAIIHALIACYAAEGSYPSSLSYLEERYGVIIDHGKYVISYGVFAPNVVPEVTIKRRK
ncbi:MAG: hypothetical protein FWG14_08515 [Peptococcaceae bacterium]|nr:hypothetical protein [Peptococcaceae bacterium]